MAHVRRGLLAGLMVLLLAVGWRVLAQNSLLTYTLPDVLAPHGARLPLDQPVLVLGRNPDARWVQVQVDVTGRAGWLPRATLRMSEQDVRALPLVPPDEARMLDEARFFNFDAPGARAAFARGQGRGRHANRFSKVGDSITVNHQFLTPLGYGRADLGGFSDLQRALDHFGARAPNAFTRTSLAAQVGWGTAHLLGAGANIGCASATVLDCELEAYAPALAVIMIGTNDVPNLRPAAFEQNLRGIVARTLDRDVVPLLSTIPPMRAHDVRPFNEAIVRVALAHDAPLVNSWLAWQALPGQGLAWDGVHLSFPEDDRDAARFDGDGLQYGVTVRNLTVLQALDHALTHTMVLP